MCGESRLGPRHKTRVPPREAGLTSKEYAQRIFPRVPRRPFQKSVDRLGMGGDKVDRFEPVPFLPSPLTQSHHLLAG